MFSGYKYGWHLLQKRGQNNINAKVTNEQAAHIRLLYATGNYTQTDLASMYGITQGNISQIVNHKAYKAGNPDETNTEEIQ